MQEGRTALITNEAFISLAKTAGITRVPPPPAQGGTVDLYAVFSEFVEHKTREMVRYSLLASKGGGAPMGAADLKG